MKLTWLESTAEVWPAVTLTLTDGSLCSTGGVHCALAPNTHLIRAALLILDAGLCEDTQSDMLKKSMSSASFWIHVDSITSRHKGHFFFLLDAFLCHLCYFWTFSSPGVCGEGGMGWYFYVMLHSASNLLFRSKYCTYCSIHHLFQKRWYH